ncbi:hypothetical protein L917_12370 [Phytophthora nicotianae]|uniref:M96 mating-specific protein family n=1 Tax=Phytophthora nicotianae TaxID=4792 RepID=W2GG95_PHYNI|nr:hypothetical protein L915_12620 [Phytophthora nicotianae]ETL88563.1 hypothetical protein L917_12370 [Phytophthora nicotianae]
MTSSLGLQNLGATAIEGDMIGADFDLEFASDLAGLYDLDEALVVRTTLNQQHHPVIPRTYTNTPKSTHSTSVLPSNEENEMEEGFQAALEFLNESEFLADNRPTAASPIENYDASSTSASDPEDTHTHNAEDTAKTKSKRRQRISAKQQIVSLRGTVEELTSKLQSLESGALKAKAKHESDQKSRTTGRGLLWQQIAARQLERRQEAERDNEKLRAMLELQVQEAKNLKRLLKRRTRIEMMEEMLGVKRYKTVTNDSSDECVDILQKMLQSTDGIYVGADHVFETKGMDHVESPGKTRTTNRHAINDVFLEILEKQLVPFGRKMTEKAVWSALGQIGVQSLQCVKDVNAKVDFYAQNSQKTDDTMMISYVAAMSGLQSSDVLTFRMRKVMRKYFDGNRTVFICLMESQPLHRGQPKGIKLHCTIRVMVEKDVEEDTTLIKSHYSVSRHTPQNEVGNVDMAIAVWDENFSRVSGEVESFLLDETTLRETNLSRQ